MRKGDTASPLDPLKGRRKKAFPLDPLLNFLFSIADLRFELRRLAEEWRFEWNKGRTPANGLPGQASRTKQKTDGR